MKKRRNEIDKVSSFCFFHKESAGIQVKISRLYYFPAYRSSS